jgi:hypothetical protein
MVEGFWRWDPIEKVGDTTNFSIEVDLAQKTVLLKERNIVAQCPFKLSIEQDEVEDIVRLLTAGFRILRRPLSGQKTTFRRPHVNDWIKFYPHTRPAHHLVGIGTQRNSQVHDRQFPSHMRA